jgi:hypothetical protein
MSDLDKEKIKQDFFDARASLSDLQQRVSKNERGADVMLIKARDRLAKARSRAMTLLDRREYEQLTKDLK